MHILVTDSGVGGLSVVAYAEQFVRLHGFREPVRLTFANAAPANDYGYNSMKSPEEKIETFDRFLRNVTERFKPDSIYVACNTLSVLLPVTPYATRPPVPVSGIVETAVDVLMAELEEHRNTTAIIFGTQTTIDSGTYPRLLAERGIDPGRIVSQACPGLADTISEDREGTKTKAEIGRWVDAALGKLPHRETKVAALLACTHYGYRREHFEEAFLGAGPPATVVNPNERAVDDLFQPDSGSAGPRNRDVEVQFVTRYAIPSATVEALSWFLGSISPSTVEAMRNFEHDPQLF